MKTQYLSCPLTIFKNSPILFGKKLLANFIVLVAAILLFFSATKAHANMLNKFKTGFYFEKYNTAEEAKAALLKLHPIGSDVDDLVKTLERAGAYSYKPIISKKYQNNPELKRALWYKYDHITISSFFPKKWDMTINFNYDKKITNFSTGFYQGE